MKKTAILVAVFILCCSACFADGEEKVSKKGLEGIVDALTKPMQEITGPVLQLDTIVVTPTKTEEKLGTQSSSVSVIGEESFDERKIGTVKEALKDEQGLDVVQTGAFGGQTSVFMRGANSNHTYVMIDGIKAYDPIAPGGGFDFGNLTLDNVDHIEVVRGPQSALYGSDAIGGVINVVMKKPDKPFFTSSFESGSYYTYKEAVNFGTKAENLYYSFGFSRFDTKGISAAQAKNNNPENDPYGRSAYSARVDYDVTDSLTIGSSFYHNFALFDYDEFRRDDPNITAKRWFTSVTGYVDHQLMDFWQYRVKLGYMVNFREDHDSNDGNTSDYLRDWYDGRYFIFDFQNNITIFDIDTFTVGYDFTKEIADSYYFHSVYGTTDMPKVFARNSSLYLQNRLNYEDRLTATQGMRVDYHSQFGTHITYKLDGSYLFPTGTKLRGGWGTGFKAPTLYQLNAPASFFFGGGNSELKPETSESYEFGLDQYLFGEKVVFSATYFHMMFHDLINSTYNPAIFFSSAYANTGKGHAHGIETGLTVRPIDTVTVNAGYTYTYTKDQNTDQGMLRRPKNKAYLNVDWEIIPKLNFNVNMNYTGPRLESGGDKLKAYTKIDLVASYKLLKNLSIYGRIENLLDKRYEETRGSGMPGFSAYGGVKAEF